MTSQELRKKIRNVVLDCIDTMPEPASHDDSYKPSFAELIYMLAEHAIPELKEGKAPESQAEALTIYRDAYENDE